jgi:hypothetical protein
MAYPLEKVVETVDLYSWRWRINPTTFVPEHVASPQPYKLFIKSTSQVPKYVATKVTDLIVQYYTCAIISPVISLAELQAIEGFGSTEKVEYIIVDRNQSSLKAINKVFGVRCLLYSASTGRLTTA